MDEKGDGERQHDQQLDAAQEGGNPGGELHPVVGKHPDRDKGDHGDQPPGNVHLEAGAQHV
jgi:hypothetical protein